MAGRKKTAIIGTNGLPAKYGGFETLTHNLVDHLKDEFDITVYCSRTPPDKRLQEFNGARLSYFPLQANGWQSLVYDFATIMHAYFHSDNLVILGLSGAFAFPFNILFKKNIVFNIGGIEWKKVRGTQWTSGMEIRLKKWMERLCVKNSQTVIIDNASFQDYLQQEYGIKPVLAEYGGDHAEASPITDAIASRYPFIRNPYDLTVSRAQEDMNIHWVIDAYKAIPNRTLVVVSNWHISEYGRNLYGENHGKYPNINLLNAIYKADELNAIRSHCRLYLHTHSLCGTAPSLVEAMSLGLPVVALDVPANRATTEGKAFYFKDVPELRELLNNMSDEQINSNKLHMSRIASDRYRWKRIAGIYRDCLGSAAGGRDAESAGYVR